MARVLAPLRSLPLFTDSMANDFQRLYGAWPTRLYLFKDGRLAYKANAVNAGFDLMVFWRSVQSLCPEYF